MFAAKRHNLSLQNQILDIQQDIFRRVSLELRPWIPAFRQRGGVLFASYLRFWEVHGQPHQSLAYALAEYGIRSHWLDGYSWKWQTSHIPKPHPLLSVGRFPALPGRRWRIVNRMATRWQWRYLERWRKRLGGQPVIWVHAGINQELESLWDKVDVFSCFDELERHPKSSLIHQNAAVLVTQNDFGLRFFQDPRAIRLIPPLDISPGTFEPSVPLALPEHFPRRRVGYFGSLFASYFNFDVLEKLVTSLPNLGFLLAGRRDAAGERRLNELRRHRNVIVLPFLPREQLAPLWNAIDVSLLCYQRKDEQKGAFASKAIESLYFGKPICYLTEPKTSALESYFPGAISCDELANNIEKAFTVSPDTILSAFAHFAYESHPRHHLAQVAARLFHK